MAPHILRIPSHPSHAPHPRTYSAFPHILRISPHILRISPHILRISPHILRISPHILRSAAYVRGYRDSVFQTHGAWALYPHIPRIPCIPRTYYATYVRGYRDSVFQTHGGMGSLSSHPRIPCISPHILRSAAYVRGRRDSVFQTHKTKKASDCSDAFLYEEISIILGLRHHCCYCGDGGEDALDGRLSLDALPQLSQDVEAMLCVIA